MGVFILFKDPIEYKGEMFKNISDWEIPSGKNGDGKGPNP